MEAAELVCKLEIDVSGITVTDESDVCLEAEEDVVIDPELPRVSFGEVIPIGAECTVVPSLLVEVAELVCKLELDVSGTTVTDENDVCLDFDEDAVFEPEVPVVSLAEVIPIDVECIVVLFVLVELVELVCTLDVRV